MFKKIINNNFSRSLLSAVLLWLAWSPNGYCWLIFIAFIPLLQIEFELSNQKFEKTYSKFLGYAYLTMLIWNLLTTWWVAYASLEGSLLAFLLNSLLMAFVLQFFHITHKKTSHIIGYASLVCYWLAFEYLHLNWDMSWPWLTLGNAFAEGYKYVQWYEYVGTQGGSLWVLVINVLIFYWLFISEQKKKLSTIIVLLITIPAIASLAIYYNYQEKVNPTNIIVTQPNIDPYNEKFSGTMNTEQLMRCINVSAGLIDDKTDFWVAPETAIALDLWENEIDSTEEILMLREFISAHPKMTLLLGSSTAKEYDTEATSTARENKNNHKFYDSFNSAIQIEKNTTTQIYHKSKLVPGVEIIPFPGIMKYFEKYAINLGGTSGSLGIQKERTAFKNKNNPVVAAPIICYESVYSEYVSEYVRNGANILFIVTNDGWWDDTPGYKQHLAYARLRAIENRRSIARSANTGISAFYNQRGDILQQSEWWKPMALKQTLNMNNDETMFTKLGDFIYKMAVLLSLGLLGLILLKKFKRN